MINMENQYSLDNRNHNWLGCLRIHMKFNSLYFLFSFFFDNKYQNMIVVLSLFVDVQVAECVFNINSNLKTYVCI